MKCDFCDNEAVYEAEPESRKVKVKLCPRCCEIFKQIAEEKEITVHVPVIQ